MNGKNKEAKKELIQKAKACIPNGYKYSSKGIFSVEKDNENLISNFIPVVLSKIVMIDIHSKEKSEYVELSALILEEGSDGDVEKLEGYTKLKIPEIDKIDFQDVVSSRLFVNPLYKSSGKVLSAIIRQQYAQTKEQIVYTASRLGFFELDVDGKKRHGYIAGNTCIGIQDLNIEISSKLYGYQLLPSRVLSMYDPKLVKDYINSILKLNDRSPVLFAYAIEAILRPLYAEAHNPIKNSVYVRGEQSTGKTTVTNLCCAMYNRNEDVEKNLHNFTASEAKLNEILNTEADMVVIIDDLRLSDSQAIMRQQEQKLDNLIRISANNVGKENKRYSYEVNGSALFIGEYALKNPSTNNRIILLDFYKTELNKEKLKKVSENPINLSYFFYHFINWVIEQYDDIVAIIERNCEEYIRKRMSDTYYQERLQSHANKLCIAYGIFLNFCEKQKWNISLNGENFNKLMQNVITEQIENLELEGREEKDYIFELYTYCYRYSEEDYNCLKNPKNTNWQQKLYWDEKDKLVYIPGNTIEKFLKELNANITVYKVIDDFQKYGMLNTDNSKQHSRTKKCAGRRCYVIDLENWKEYVQELVYRKKDRIN